MRTVKDLISELNKLVDNTKPSEEPTIHFGNSNSNNRHFGFYQGRLIRYNKRVVSFYLKFNEDTQLFTYGYELADKFVQLHIEYQKLILDFLSETDSSDWFPTKN